ncbi:MAG: hypothetical protein DRO40_12000 [Thermoprotei archaeon]|nr:MAG: hypothetical protein DRO40_12000 [Thermoprotei archaeon]
MIALRIKEKILVLLKEHREGLRQADIVKALGVSRSYVSEIMKELIRAGIVKRVIESGIAKYVLAREQPFGEKKPKILKLGIIWSSEYPFITYFGKYLKVELNIQLEPIVYSNALEATWDAVTGKIDLVLSPLVTQFIYASLTGGLTIIGGGASGGARLYENPSSRTDASASSKASTMDLLLTFGLRELGIPDTRRYYASSGEEIMMLLASGRVKYAAIWEPLATRLKKMGFKEIYTIDDLRLPHCCTLGASRSLAPDYKTRIKKIYGKALEEFAKKPEQALEWYALKTGIQIDLLKESIKHYIYKPYLEIQSSVIAFNKAGLHIPSPSTLKEVIEYN